MTRSSARSSDALDRQLAYFRAHQAELAEAHHGQVVLIHDESVVGFYGSDAEAYAVAIKRHDVGSFLIRRCLRVDEEQPQVLHSRVGVL